jgi:glycosyltransferase involved in cell wall biosynthesis
MMTEERGLPLLSIIIPTFNMGRSLEACLASVFREIENYYPNAEVIVIDGGSKDETVELLKKYESKISYWVSEPDSGASEAINKGLARARGEIVYFIGADDELVAGAALHMVSYLEEHPEVDVVIGYGEHFQQNAEGGLGKIDYAAPLLGRLTLKHFLKLPEIGWPVPELQFARKRVYDHFGGYDPRRSNMVTFIEVYCRHAKNGVVFERIPKIVARRCYAPNSSYATCAYDQKYFRDLYSILWKYGGGAGVLGWHIRANPSLRDVFMAPFHVAHNLGFRPLGRTREFFRTK